MKTNKTNQFLVVSEKAQLTQEAITRLLRNPRLRSMDYTNKEESEQDNLYGWALVSGAYFCGANREDDYQVYQVYPENGKPVSDLIKVAASEHYVTFPVISNRHLKYLSGLGNVDMNMRILQDRMAREERLLESMIEEFVGTGSVYKEAIPKIKKITQSKESIYQALYEILQKDAMKLMKNQW